MSTTPSFHAYVHACGVRPMRHRADFRARDRQFVGDVYLPFGHRTWKASTASTSEQIVKSHLIPEFGERLLQAISREELQDFLDRKVLELSSSVVSHLRWFLNGIFKLALSDG